MGSSDLSDVSLHRLGIPHASVVGVLAGVSTRPALVKEIPALVQRHLEDPEALALRLRDLRSSLTLPEFMLLSRELVDSIDDLLIVHG